MVSVSVADYIEVITRAIANVLQEFDPDYAYTAYILRLPSEVTLYQYGSTFVVSWTKTGEVYVIKLVFITVLTPDTI